MLDDFDATVLAFIQDYGTTFTLVKSTGEAYDPATATVVQTTEDIPVQAILMDLTLQSNGLSVKYGTLIQAGDKELYMRPPHKTNPTLSPVEIVPAIDKIVAGNIVYNIVTMKELNPSGSDPILFTLYLRR
jgi:hypothetical protein